MDRDDMGKILLGAVVGAITVEVVRETNPGVIKELKESVKGLVKSVRTLYSEFDDRVNRAIKVFKEKERT
jgi:hypothetical protein